MTIQTDCRTSMHLVLKSKTALWIDYSTMSNADLSARSLIGAGIAIESRLYQIKPDGTKNLCFHFFFDREKGRVEKCTDEPLQAPLFAATIATP